MVTVTNPPMMKIRRRRGGLQESMATMQEIPATREAVLKYLQETNAYLGFNQEELGSITVHLHGNRPDDRIGWKQTYAVVYTLAKDKETWVIAYCDQALVN